MFITNLLRVFILVALLASGVGIITNGHAEAYEQKYKVVKTTLGAPYTQAQVVLATNKAREKDGIEPLSVDPLLTRAAQAKAQDMVKNNYFSHETPSGKPFWEFIDATGYEYMDAGENLAVHYKNIDTLMSAWLNSPGHRANILGEQFTDIGIGIAYGERKGQKGWFVVQMFGSKL